MMKKILSSKKTKSINQENIIKDNSIIEKVKEPPIQEDLVSSNKSNLNDVKIKLP